MRTAGSDELYAIVDMDDQVVGAQPRAEIRRHLLPHRAVAIALSDQVGEMLVRSVVPSSTGSMPALDVLATDMVRAEESYQDAAERLAQAIGMRACGVVRTVGPNPGNGYSFTALVEAASCRGINVGRLELRALELGHVNRSIVMTYRLAEAVRTLVGDENRAVVRRLANWFDDGVSAPGDAVRASSDDEQDRLVKEIERHRSAGRPRGWHGDLVRIYDNQMPQYPAPDGLELGALVLGAEEIAAGLDTLCERIVGRYGRGPIRVVAKLRSGALVANELEQRLGDAGVEVERYDIRSVWEGYCTARIVGAGRPLQPMVNVVCDTMISTGATQRSIVQRLEELGGGSESIAVALVARRRPRIFEPDMTLAVTSVEGNDWLVGYNSDALAGGIEYLRSLPFIAVLKPRGMGARARLVEAGIGSEGER